MKNYVAYYRVSTKQQGASGLGLDAQRAAVRSFTKCETCIIAEYTEIESGKNDKREQLNAAIAHAKQAGATLVIAKLDRLSRNASFIFALRDSGVEFVCADMPEANTLTIGIFATLAQHEREIISQRTKAALQAKKAQGFALGNPQNLTETARINSAISRRKQAREHNKQAVEIAILLRDRGWSMRKIAERLNALGFRTRRGKNFYVSAVARLLNVYNA
jgi:DNA invertase Pin-like site-specific DNA recombinase